MGTLWMPTGGGSILLDGAGNAILCDTCPCDDQSSSQSGSSSSSSDTVDLPCCPSALPQTLYGNFTNFTGCASFTAGVYPFNWDPDLSSGLYVAYLSETFRVLLYCADLGQSDRLYVQHQCFLSGQWRDAIGASFRELEGPGGTDQAYECDPFEGYVDNYQVQKITYVNEFGFTVDDNCCGDVTTWTFDLEITE